MFEKPLDNCSWVQVCWKKMQLISKQNYRKACPGNPTPRWHDLTKLNRFSRLKVGTCSLDCLALSGTFAPTIIFIFAFFLYFPQFWKYVPSRQIVDVRIMCGNCRWVLRCHDIAKNQNYLESPCNVMINWKENPDISLLVTRSTWKSLSWANVVLGKTSRRENGWISNGIQEVLFFSDFKTQASVIFLPGAQGKILPGFWKLSVWWIHYGEGWIFIESSLGKEKN